jgi:hypothetical protein
MRMTLVCILTPGRRVGTAKGFAKAPRPWELDNPLLFVLTKFEEQAIAYPKIELHVHLEGTVRPSTLIDIARRNDVALPADTVEGLADLYRFRDFAHFIEVWVMTTSALHWRSPCLPIGAGSML